MSTVAIVDYGSGNLRSAAKSFERAANEAGLSYDIVVTGNPDLVPSPIAGPDSTACPAWWRSCSAR